MNQTLTISQARSALPSLSRKLAREARPDAVTITQKGKPVLALMNWEFYESLIETLEILDDKEMMAALRQGIKEAKAGKGISWEAARRRLV
jgi:PHD/YefM family antitoxin component YafN of YafNO toxin-antitoxin module